VILILSDIHLANTAERSTINLDALNATILQTAGKARDRKADSFKVLLLGDIFEVLKSQLDQRRSQPTQRSRSESGGVLGLLERPGKTQLVAVRIADMEVPLAPCRIRG
jgi:hypothetical protein